MSQGSHTPLVGIVGPTASGKTDLAVAVARRLTAEILIADSRQVYRGMDIGTAKPDANARASVPHHLLDLVAPDEPFTVADWVARARALIPRIGERGALPMLVGGTGLYVSALVDGHDYAGQPRSTAIRERLTAELDADGLEPLARRLVEVDPVASAAIDVRNPRRVVRALERAEAGGGGAVPRSMPYPGTVVLLALDRPRAELYRRIDERARRLFDDGLVAEVEGLVAAGYPPQLRAMSGHGYAEAARHLAGEWSLEDAITATARRTRQYAKRQLTWFRRTMRVVWLPAGTAPGDDPTLVDAAERAIRRAVG